MSELEPQPAPKRSLGQQLQIGAAFMVAGRLVIRMLSVISTLILARLLVPADFGLVALALAMLTIAGAITDLGYAAVLIRVKDLDRSYFDTAWSLNLLRCLALGLVLGASGGWQGWLLGDARIGPLLWVIGLTVALDGLTSVGLLRLQRDMQFDRLAHYQVYGRLVAFLSTIILAVIWQNYWCLVIGSLIGKMFVVPFSYWTAPFRPHFNLQHWRYFLAFTKWNTLFNISAIMEIQSPILISGYFLGLPTLGLFNTARQIALVPITEIAVPTRTPMYSTMAHFIGKNDHLRKNYMEGQGFLFTIVFPISVGIAMISPEIESIALGPQWAGAYVFICVLTFVALIDNFSGYMLSILSLFGKFRLIGVSSAYFALMRIFLLAILTYFFGLTGLFAALILASSIAFYLMHRMTADLLETSVSELLLPLWRPVVAAAVMITGIVAVRSVLPPGQTGFLAAAGKLAIIIPLGATLHIASQYLLWRICGAPPGAESRIAALALGALSRFRHRSPA